MDVVLVTSHGRKSSYTGYSDRPDLIRRWVVKPHEVTDELVQHILDNYVDPLGYDDMDEEQVREELDPDRFSSNGRYSEENALLAIAHLLPPVKNIQSQGFIAVEEYQVENW